MPNVCEAQFVLTSAFKKQNKKKQTKNPKKERKLIHAALRYQIVVK